MPQLILSSNKLSHIQYLKCYILHPYVQLCYLFLQLEIWELLTWVFCFKVSPDYMLGVGYVFNFIRDSIRERSTSKCPQVVAEFVSFAHRTEGFSFLLLIALGFQKMHGVPSQVGYSNMAIYSMAYYLKASNGDKVNLPARENLIQKT